MSEKDLKQKSLDFHQGFSFDFFVVLSSIQITNQFENDLKLLATILEK